MPLRGETSSNSTTSRSPGSAPRTFTGPASGWTRLRSIVLMSSTPSLSMSW